MPYIGNPIYQSAFVVDQFNGNGSTTAFTMSVAPAGVTNVLVAVSGVLQDPSTYGVVGNTITFSAAPPSGTGNISCRYLGVPASGVTTTAYRTVTEFTATASQTTFTPPSYTVGFINVYLNGVLLGSADYTATNGTTVVLTTGALAGNLVTVESFQVSSVLNAIPNTAGSVSSANIANDVTINFADGSASTPSITNNGDTNTGIFFPAADTIAFTEGGVESMRIDSSGNVGIGNTSASSFASTTNLALGTGSSSAALTVYTGTAQTGAVYFADGTTSADRYRGAIEYTHSNNALLFTTDASERMRIDSSGNLLVGTTSANIGFTTGSKSINMNNAYGSAYAIGINDNTGGNGYFLGFGRGGSQCGYIWTNASNSTQYVTSSDYRLKENVKPMADGLGTVLKLKPCTYTWKEDGTPSQGFIAHELQEVVPEAVAGEKDAVDADGNIKPQGIDTSFLVATLTAAIQELKATVDAQALEIAALKDK
jgi:hypothetical protein